MAADDKANANKDQEKEGIEFVKVTQQKTDLRKKEPPLVDLKVSNPVTYIKTWWRRIIGNEGIEFKLKVKPLTAISITIIIVTVTYGLGRFKLPFKIPFFEYSSEYEPTPIPDSSRETAFTGILRASTKDKYYLLTQSSEAITLEVPEKVVLSELVGLRIFATGRFNPDTRTLTVANVTGLEILSSSPSPIPTASPTPEPFTTPEAATIPAQL